MPINAPVRINRLQSEDVGQRQQLLVCHPLILHDNIISHPNTDPGGAHSEWCGKQKAERKQVIHLSDCGRFQQIQNFTHCVANPDFSDAYFVCVTLSDT